MRVERLDLHQPRGAELDHRDAPAGGPGRRLGPKSRRAGRLVLPGQGGTGRQVDGGLVLNGTWSFASGIDFADWENLQVSIRKEQGPPDHRFVLVPKTDFTIEDDWFVTGLSGTASKSVVLENVFVPEHRVLDTQLIMGGPSPGSTVNPSPLYRGGAAQGL